MSELINTLSLIGLVCGLLLSISNSAPIWARTTGMLMVVINAFFIWRMG